MIRRACAIGFLVMALFIGTVWAEEKCDGLYGEGDHTFSLATGSPGELGILKELAEAFSKETKTKLCWTKAGSGQSLKLLQDKKVDMIMVHAPAAEKKAIADGWAANRKLIGSNEFYIVGPANDPAKIGEAKTAADAYSKIAGSQAKFFSRGDSSGTHKKEMDIWKKAAIDPQGPWYVVTKDFMTATLKRANQENGYFMTDSSTWAAEKQNLPNLKILFRGDPYLVNTYHTLSQPEGATPGQKWAVRFIEFVASDKGQKILSDFGKDKHGEGLYNDANYAKQYDK
ncbi:substrate-binding domain-containing protein [Desulfomonile tiedjei]|uniref:ABC-type tungstate transport system, permease component n=1 Tax=Desulfomonile tiedjei (strain ATCC 49306 / DSM 6799 / DCB-1) TaxID=706587 RepID=I4BZS5_DESTA|nr:substrate-binding domain-containing protein [Desulfomonile tiedjei]AFM22816.1 ABC-type tungstate transport system, permease component [Desulfomonile tiedjei DSM 6799]